MVKPISLSLCPNTWYSRFVFLQAIKKARSFQKALHELKKYLMNPSMSVALKLEETLVIHLSHH
jgi:hypothetical protein